MKCYSFLRTIAGATGSLQEQLAGMDAHKVTQSVLSFSWRAITPGGAGIGSALRPFIQGANSEGVDDLEPEESNQWHESMKEWQLESQRLDFQPAKFGLPLTQHFVNRVVCDGERLESVVDEWSANIGDYGDTSFSV